MAVRERTDSITHLVKIVAKEIVDEELRSSRLWSKGTLDILGDRITELENRVILYQVDNDLKNAGDKWSSADDQLLVDSVNRAIKIIAAAHGRTPVAILSRIQQKGLIRGGGM